MGLHCHREILKTYILFFTKMYTYPLNFFTKILIFVWVPSSTLLCHVLQESAIWTSNSFLSMLAFFLATPLYKAWICRVRSSNCNSRQILRPLCSSFKVTLNNVVFVWPVSFGGQSGLVIFFSFTFDWLNSAFSGVKNYFKLCTTIPVIFCCIRLPLQIC